MSTNIGKVVQVIGPVVDVVFPKGELPAIYNAITITKGDEQASKIVVEVMQHLGAFRVPSRAPHSASIKET